MPDPDTVTGPVTVVEAVAVPVPVADPVSELVVDDVRVGCADPVPDTLAV